MRRARSGALGALAMTIVALQGCTPEKPGSDRASSTTASTCAHRVPPPRPNVKGSGGTLDLVFAVSYASYGTDQSSVDDAGRPAYLGYGFDLDDTCTGEGQGPSCLEPSWADAGHTDGVDGIDNALGQAVAMQLLVGQDHGPMTETVANQIIRVRGYSGEADDDEVDVALYMGFGLAPRYDGSTGLLWDGKDRWMILPDTLAPLEVGGVTAYSLDQPRFHDEHAYVTGGVLVARLPEALWPTGLVLEPSSLGQVEQVVLAGNLVRVGAQWELQHLVTGVRDPVRALLPIVARIALQGGPPICQSAADYQMIRARICPFVDIASGPDSPSVACDAISGGSVLEAKQALLGGIGAKAEELPPCASGVHPETDSCDPMGNP